MAYWLIKTEPSTYSFGKLTKEKKTSWTGIRNYEARNNLRAMKPGDLALYYHTGDEKQVVGIARVASPPGPDKTAKAGEDWVAVDVEPAAVFKEPVTLSTVKATKELKEFGLVKKGRISVIPVKPLEWKKILSLGKTKV